MNMNTTKLIAVPALMGALLLAATGHQAQAAGTDATLTVANYTSVTATPTLTMSPSLADINLGSIEALGGIDLDVITNNGTGCKVTVSAGAGGAGKIAPGDIYLKVASAQSGAAAGSFGSYVALGTLNADLWNTTGAELTGTAVGLDVKFGNLSAYPAVAGLSTNYTNTITFTAVPNS